MTLRYKTLGLLAIVSLVLLLLQSIGAKQVLDNSYRKLEQKDARRNLGRVQNIFQDSLDQMNRSAGDWAHRDETYAFIQNQASSLEKNLSLAIFDNAKWNHLILVNNDGEIVKAWSFDLNSSRFVSNPPSLQLKKLDAWQSFLPREHREAKNGVWLLEQEPQMFASQWILNSDLDAEPKGLLIATRQIESKLIQSLSERLRLDILIAAVFSAENPPTQTLLNRATTDLKEPKFFDLNEEFTELFINISDYLDKPALQLKVTLKRDFYQQAKTNSLYLFATVLLVGLIFSGLIYIILDKLVLKRISQLSQDIHSVEASHSFEARVRPLGEDELGHLASTINAMLKAQGELHGQLELEQKKTEDLLLNILPRKVVDKLKLDSSAIAERFNDTTILFADIVGFTTLSAKISPEELVQMLNTIFSAFDHLAEKHHLEKIKTIGDAYMVVGGLPERRADHAQLVAAMGLDMIEALHEINKTRSQELKIRIGIHSGPVVAGVLGTKKFLYDLWGDAVNTASRMESSGIPGCVQISEGTYELIKDDFEIEKRGSIEVKGKGLMATYLLKGKKSKPSSQAA